jgi:uncharacterized protein
MRFEEYEWLAAVVEAHPNHTVNGRTRVQKTVKLLQRLGFPTEYRYSMHHYGPFSEAVQSDLSLLKQRGLLSEEGYPTQDGRIRYVIRTERVVELPDVNVFRPALQRMVESEPVVLELAATYDAFRESGLNHGDALERLRLKKGAKCDGGREQQALQLLERLGLAGELAPQ